MRVTPFELKIVHGHPLTDDGLKVCEAVSVNSKMKTTQELENILILGDLRTIILLKRYDISQAFMNEVSNDAFDEHEPSQNDWHLRWNESGGTIATNAMPHIHEYANCHAAPEASECSTAFFVRGAVIEAVRALATDRKYPIDLRSQLANAVARAEEGDVDAFFESLHAIHPTREGWLPILTLVQEMQKRIRAVGGMYEVSREKDGYGIVAIPPLSVHGRTAADHMVRQERTAWRYFGNAVDRKS